MSEESPSVQKIGTVLIGFLLVSLSAGFIGSQFTPDLWYYQIDKPDWTPPNRIFAPVWILLYFSMGIAAWLVWLTAGFRKGLSAFVIFFLQLAANTAWSVLFFGMHSPKWAFFDIILLWLLILIMIAVFWRFRRLAALILIPYLLWVSFASVLNFTIWRLNT